MIFETGAKVVYPAHGIAEVLGRETVTIDGVAQTYLRLHVAGPDANPAGGLLLSVPEDRAVGIGVRLAMSSGEAREVLEVLAVSDVRVPSNWSRRFKNHQEKLRSGDIYQCAEVVRNLAAHQAKKRLAPAESRMYDNARYNLISELAVTWEIDYERAEQRVDEALAS